MERFSLDAKLTEPFEVKIPLSDDCTLMYNRQDFDLVGMRREESALLIQLQPLSIGTSTLVYVRMQGERAIPLVSYDIIVPAHDVNTRRRCSHALHSTQY